MPLAIHWTPDRDAALLQLRADGMTWDAIARSFGISRNSALDRGRAYDLPRARAVPDPRTRQAAGSERCIDIGDGRVPLPPGDPVSWGAITELTVLAGCPYQASEPDPGSSTR